MHLSQFIVHLSRTYHLSLKESWQLALTVLHNKGLLKEFPSKMSVIPPDSAPYWQAMNTMVHNGDPDWPYNDDPKAQAHMKGELPGETPGGLPQHREDDDEDFTPAVNKDRLPKEEAEDLMGAGTGSEYLQMQVSKDREERRKQWSHGEKYDMKKKFEHNYKKSNKDKAMGKKLTKEELMQRIVEHEFSKALFEEFRGRLLHEKAPAGKYPPTGTPYSKIAKGIAKSDSDVNPYAASWALKNKASKKENKKPTLEQFKESVEGYFKEMGFDKVGKAEGVDVWRKKSPKRPKMEDVSCDFVNKKAKEAGKKKSGK